jgi:tetratricopeptide (TPR) repeat protein
MPAPDCTQKIITRWRQKLANRPEDATAHFGLGTALWTSGTREEAIAYLARAVELDPGNADARSYYGNSLSAIGRFADAAKQYRSALELEPDAPELHYNLGNMLLATGQAAEAEACYHATLARKPDHAGAHNNLGNALRGQGRHEKAINCYRRALDLRPEYFGTQNNIGSALLALHRPAEAIPYFQDALAARPDYAEACNNLGGAMLALGRPGEAVGWFQRAVELDPDQEQARFGEALALLAMGDFRRGWRAYEARWRNPQFIEDTPEFFQPRWSGDESVVGKTILLHAEQGLGDTIQFVRYAPLLRARGATVVLSVPTPLTTLFEDLADIVIPQAETFPPHDLHCPLMSLPLAFGTELDTIPADIRYLLANQSLVERWSAKLGARKKPRVGIAWSGSADHPEDALRSIPLREFLPPLRTGTVELHVLQTDISPADQAVLDGATDVVVHRAMLSDFSATAALISCLDLVISVDTSVAHLAGALGAPTWLLIQSSADFRWMRDRMDSPWYPTMRLFRQKTLLEWAPVLSAVAAALEML